MPSPTTSLATLRPDLATLIEFDLEQNRLGYIGLHVAPVIDVGKPSGTFGRIPVKQLLQSPDTARAPGSGYNRGTFKFETDTYQTYEQGWEEPIDDKEKAMYANYFDAEAVSTLRAYNHVLGAQEKRIADLVFNTTTFTGSSLTTAVAIPWSTVATADPVGDVEAAVLKVYANSGIWPNTLIITRKTFRILRRVAQIIDLITASGAGQSAEPGKITTQQLATVFDLQNILVAGSSRNSANEGAAAVLGSVWSDTMAMVCYIDPTGDVRRPTLARTFHWGEDGSQIGGTVETYRDETVRGNVVRVRHEVGEKIMYTQAGHLLTGVQ